MRFTQLLLILTVLGTEIAEPAPGHAGPQLPTLGWKLTDVWEMNVERYSRTSPRVVTYSVKARIIAPAAAAGSPAWWVLRFEASRDAPEHVRHRHSVWLEKYTGWPGKVSITDPVTSEQHDKQLEAISDATVLAEPIDGLPIEMFFPTIEPRTITDPTRKSIELKRTKQGDSTTMTALIRIPGKEDVRLSQEWKNGEVWWRESTRWVGERKQLRATLAKVHSNEETERILREDVNCHLAWDKRLCVLMTFVEENPRMSDLIEAIRRVTGVQLSLPNIAEGHDPTLGNVQLRDSPAWVGMKLIAKECFDTGEWEPLETGYRLKARGPKSGQVPNPPPLFELRTWLAMSLLALASVALVLVYLRNGRRTSGAQSKGTEDQPI